MPATTVLSERDPLPLDPLSPLGSWTLPDFGSEPAHEVLRAALERFHPRFALVTSFQAGGMVLLDLAVRILPEVRVVTVDTGRLPAETHQMIDTVRRRYGIEVEVYVPDAHRLQAMVRRGGPNLFYDGVSQRQECCHVRKVEPLERALGTVDAWVTGLRRDQSPERASTPKVAPDRRFGSSRSTPLWKIAPLTDWSAAQVWEYVETHDVPRHPLYDRGYTSIGCAPCTRPPREGAGDRDGRWWWESDSVRECGLHVVRDGER